MLLVAPNAIMFADSVTDSLGDWWKENKGFDLRLLMFTRKPAITRRTVGPRGSRETWPNERDSRQLMDCTALPNGRDCRRGERWLRSYITAEILLFHCALTTESVWLRVCACAWNIPGSAHKELSCGAFIYSSEAADVVTQRHQRRCFQSVARLVGDHILRRFVADFVTSGKWSHGFHSGFVFERHICLRRSRKRTLPNFQTSLTRLAEGDGPELRGGAALLLLLMFPHQSRPPPFLLESRTISGLTTNAAANGGLSGSLSLALLRKVTKIHRSRVREQLLLFTFEEFTELPLLTADILYLLRRAVKGQFCIAVNILMTR